VVERKNNRAITVKESGKYYAWVTNQYGMTVKSMVFEVVVHDTLDVKLARRRCHRRTQQWYGYAGN
jgi:peptidyl-tRNA hydrolase